MAFDTFVECVRNGKMCMYFVCDFKGRWLKYFNILCCVSILLASVEGRLIGDCTIKFISLKWESTLFLKYRARGIPFNSLWKGK